MPESGWWRDDRQPGYRKPRRRPEQREQREQRFLFDWLRVTKWRGRPLADYAYHPANGGWRTKVSAAVLKGQGVSAGVPDVVLTIAASGFHGLYIELKSATGRVTPEQNAWHERLIEQGYLVTVSRSWNEAATAIALYLDLPSETWPWSTPVDQKLPLRRKRKVAAVC